MRDMGCCQPRRIIRLRLRQVRRPVDEDVTLTRYEGCKNTDLAICDLFGSPGVLAGHAAGGLALHQKAGLINDHNRILRAEVLDDIISHAVTQLVADFT